MVLISSAEMKHKHKRGYQALTTVTQPVLIIWSLFQQIIICKVMTLLPLFSAVLTSGDSCHCHTCKLHPWQRW